MDANTLLEWIVPMKKKKEYEAERRIRERDEAFCILVYIYRMVYVELALKKKCKYYSNTVSECAIANEK